MEAAARVHQVADWRCMVWQPVHGLIGRVCPGAPNDDCRPKGRERAAAGRGQVPMMLWPVWDATRVCVSERGRILNLSCRPFALVCGVICWLVCIASTYAVSSIRTKAVMVTEANLVHSWIHYPVPSSIITTARHGSPWHQLTAGCFGSVERAQRRRDDEACAVGLGRASVACRKRASPAAWRRVCAARRAKTVSITAHSEWSRHYGGVDVRLAVAAQDRGCLQGHARLTRWAGVKEESETAVFLAASGLKSATPGQRSTRCDCCQNPPTGAALASALQLASAEGTPAEGTPAEDTPALAGVGAGWGRGAVDAGRSFAALLLHGLPGRGMRCCALAMFRMGGQAGRVRAGTWAGDLP